MFLNRSHVQYMCEVKVKLITKENICSRALFFWVVVTITETALPRAFETGGNIFLAVT